MPSGQEQAELYIDLLSHDINMNAAVSSYLQAAVDKMDIEAKNMQYFSSPRTSFPAATSLSDSPQDPRVEATIRNTDWSTWGGC